MTTKIDPPHLRSESSDSEKTKMSIEYLITHVQGESNIWLQSNEILGSSLCLNFDESLHNYTNCMILLTIQLLG